MNLPDTIFDNSQHSDKLSKIACRTPFNSLHIDLNGNVSNCCFLWMPKYIGNVKEASLLTILNSAEGNKTKLSVTDGGFKYCSVENCPSLAQYLNHNVVTNPLILNSDLSKINQKEIVLFLDYDNSCNLYCESCRNERVLHTEQEYPNFLLQIHQAVVDSVTEFIAADFEVTLHITGAGDGFASPFYWSFLKNIKGNEKFKISLTTNGNLMTPERLSFPYAQKIWYVEVSVDAATEATYKKIRRGGNYKTLLNNLNNFNKMYSMGQLPSLIHWRLNFVVQKDNYKEMVPFINWALQYEKIDSIWFTLIHDWGHLTKEKFSEKAIWQKNHPEHAEFLKALQDPIFLHPKVILSNLSPFRK